MRFEGLGPLPNLCQALESTVKNGVLTDHFINIGRNKFIQMDGILVRSTNPFYFTIKAAMCVHIYYEKFPVISEEESLKVPYLVEVLNCLVDVSTGGTFC